MKKLFLFLAVFISLNVNAQTVSINHQKIDSLIDYIEQNNLALGAVSIFQNGKEVYSRTFGKMNVAAEKRNPGLKYDIGSCSKMVTAALIFKLIEEKKITLDTKLAQFFPNIPNAGEITIKHLLEHSSGLQDYGYRPNDLFWLTKKVSKEAIIDEIIKQGVAFKPGEKVAYSNSGYYLLARIVEKEFKTNYASVVKKYIIRPCGLKDFASFENKNYQNIAFPYFYDSGWNLMQELYLGNDIGVGDMASSVQDANIFITDLFAGKIISKKSLEGMKPKDKEEFGRGLMTAPFDEIISYGHGGDVLGTHSAITYDEKNKLAISLALNGDGGLGRNGFAISLSDIIYHNKLTFPDIQTKFKQQESDTKDEKIDFDSVKDYLGAYFNPYLPMKIRIFYEDSCLKSQATRQPAIPLVKTGQNTFSSSDSEIVVKFNATGEKMKIVQSGLKIELTKRSE